MKLLYAACDWHYLAAIEKILRDHKEVTIKKLDGPDYRYQCIAGHTSAQYTIWIPEEKSE